MCESQEWKARRLIAVHSGVPVFKDMCALGGGYAQEWADLQVKPVPKARLETSHVMLGAC
jgi:hypothetical protein